jgi:NADH-quinone oxidoreductase subunit L
MVTAGVYLMCRVNPLLTYSADWVSPLIAWVGVLTALVAATIACAQMDIKKVLAYSTVSQLGYMFLAVGTGAYWAAIFHMVTHAFFKALLFLGSGSVIHGMHDEQDMRRMGGLRRFMPITAITMMIGWLAIAGIPPLSGFWSKDEILGHAFGLGTVSGYALWAVGTLVAILTAYYMTRLIVRTFYGDENWRITPVPNHGETMADALAKVEPEQRDAALAAVPDLDVAFIPEPPHGHIGPDYEPHESPWTMTVPLVVLAVLAVFGGFLSVPFGELNFFEKWLEPSFELSPAIHAAETTQIIGLLVVGALIAVVGVAAGWQIWTKRTAAKALEPAVFGNAWYYDLSISRVVAGPGRVVFDALAWFDRTIIDGAVNGVGIGTAEASALLRRMQTGFVRRYALGIGFGSIILLGYLVAKVLAS